MIFSLPRIALLSTLLFNVVSSRKLLTGYWASYSDQLSVTEVPYAQYDHLHYFVMIPTSSPSSISLAGIDPSVVQQFVTLAHAAGTTVSYTIGGYTGSKYFSSHVSTALNRRLFASALVRLMTQYGFDGIDFDWEYPGGGGDSGNIVSPNDAANFQALLQLVRAAVPKARLSMAAQVTGINGPDGNYLSSLSVYASTLDYVTVMAYDIFGFYSQTTGPNSPLYSCLSSNPFSVDSGVTYYQKAGFAPSQILIGFPAYAYAYSVAPPLTTRTCSGYTSQLYQEQTTSASCGNYYGSIAQYTYNEILLFRYTNARSGWAVTRDTASASVSTYNSARQIFIPYDDDTSGKTKASYAVSKGLAGMNMFDINGDTAQFALAKALGSVLHA
ncbi:glycoside hydrolase family 18 protein [Pseudohyphozyma bogoriensis]|nr:glycoside hydrolase family 18 protein [Pseudohyphozyma bogoriensis]